MEPLDVVVEGVAELDLEHSEIAPEILDRLLDGCIGILDADGDRRRQRVMRPAQRVRERHAEPLRPEIVQRDVHRGAGGRRIGKSLAEFPAQRGQLVDPAPDEPLQARFGERRTACIPGLAGHEPLRRRTAEPDRAIVGLDSDDAVAHRIDGPERDRVRAGELEVLDPGADATNLHERFPRRWASGGGAGRGARGEGVAVDS